ncbi:MAG: RNA polymerase sigma factor [Prevotella sp.]|nr:RNA polymerase sigma factor [Prevotella sp.]
MKVDFRNDILPLKDALYRLALRITLDSAEAEDVVQETMLKLWNRRDRWDEIESIEAFAMTICRNLALDAVKRAENNHVSFDEAAALLSTPNTQHPTPFDHTVAQDRIQIVRQIIDTLPEKQRTCVQLRDIEEKPYKEIAAILDISEEQVKVNIFRARQTIRQRFAEMENYKKGSEREVKRK